MEKEFVPYKESLELRKLGFDEPCFGAYGRWGFMSSNDVHLLSDEVTQEYLDNKNYTDEDGVCLAPLYQQAFRWFRDNYQLHSTITSISQKSWQCHITKPNESLGKLYDEDFYTYEEAELACLRKLINIVKDGKDTNGRRIFK